MNIKKNNLNNNEIVDALNGIKIILILILIVFVAYTVIFAVSVNGAPVDEVTDDQVHEEMEVPEYDVSKFNEVDYSGFKKLTTGKGTHVIYIGRATCSFCAMFIPTMVEAQEKYGFTTDYFDISKVFNFETNSVVDQNAYDEMSKLNDFMKENFLATPMVLIFKNGKYVDATLGYQDINTYSQFLEKNDFKAK